VQISGSVGASAKAKTGEKHPVFPVGHVLPFVFFTVLFFLWGM
jgi:FHS family L-fucose permease-like MFS transporter